jgi:Ca2+-binding EF-hand superfamily protein
MINCVILSGTLSLDELVDAYTLIGMPVTKATAAALLSDVDADGSGTIDFAEFR